ncbi:MAG: hypothetical protein AAB488_01305, partial [Patescibacteria group bacterium]
MENRKYLIFLLVFVFLFIPLFSFAYKPDTTHKGLTRDVIKLYEYYYSNRFTDSEKISIEKGAVDEDNGTRALNHFYDPVYNKGIVLTSKDWSQNTIAQKDWGGKGLATAGTYVGALFDSNTDYSWDRAIYEYLYGDKNRGLESLGHILHLIEDVTTPDHTRNDLHPDFVYQNTVDQESPYENFTNKFDISNINISKNLINEGLKPVIYLTLGEYFDRMAIYSNNNFFSKDTIFEKKYNQPQISFEKVQKLSDGNKYLFGFNKISNSSEYKLVRIRRSFSFQNGTTTDYYITDNDYSILTDYWNLLSRQAVLNGAGVIKLFFDEVEKEKQTHALYEKNKSWLARTKDSVLNIFSSSLDISKNQNLASV